MRIISSLLCIVTLLFLSGCASNGGNVPVDNAWNDVASTQSSHKVQPGETIYSIAWRYGIDYKQLAAWNNLQPPYYLRIGQVLRLTPPKEAASKPVAVAPTFKPVSSTTATLASTASAATITGASTKTSTSKATDPNHSEPSDISAIDPNAAKAESAVNISSVASNGKNWSWPVKGKVIKGYGMDGSKGIDIAVPAGTPVKAVQSGSVVYAGSNLHGYGELVIVKQKDNLMTAYAHNSRLLVKEGSSVKAGQTIAMSGDTEAPRAMLHFEVRQAGKPVDPLPFLRAG